MKCTAFLNTEPSGSFMIFFLRDIQVAAAGDAEKPMLRATTAVEVMPRAVVFYRRIHALDILRRGLQAHQHDLPAAAIATASSAVKQTLLLAARRCRKTSMITLAFFNAAVSNCGCSSESSALGIYFEQSFFLPLLSKTNRSTAIFKAAAAVCASGCGSAARESCRAQW